MNKKLFYIICTLLFSLLFVSCATLPLNKEHKKITYSYKTVEISENLDYLETNIKYPEFTDLPDLNKRIANTVMSNWRNFKGYSKTEWNEIANLNNRGNGKLSPFEYHVTFEVSGSSSLVSIILNTYVFNGGAHGNTSLISLNYDTSSAKYLDIKSVSGLSYNEISERCRAVLYKRLIDDDKTGMPPSEKDSIREMINTGAFPQAGNFEIFTVDGTKIYLWFEPYSVAPYSYGVQRVQIK